jgi:SRSO17 transposase
MRRASTELAAQSRRLEAYLDGLTPAAGHADRVLPMRSYTKGLMLPLQRKSVEPMAACLHPEKTRQAHQSLHHIVAEAAWSDAALLARVRQQVLPAMTRRSRLAAWIVDDTGFPKKGRHSVGVARQYCGQSGKKENCRVAVSVSLATEKASLPVAYRLYLPEEWANDVERRARTGVPESVPFQTKPQMALEQIGSLLKEGVPRGVVLADAAYGNSSGFREALEELQLTYSVGIQASTLLWPMAMASPVAQGKTGRRRQARLHPLGARELALCLGKRDWHTVTWRRGERGKMRSRFAALRVCAEHCGSAGGRPRTELWLLVEWPRGEKEPTRYWLSNLPEAMPLRKLVATSKLRWRVERDYEELKQELGLGHYEGRNWRGFHHHATLSIAAYGFLVLEQHLFPPSEEGGRVLRLRLPARRSDDRRRGAGSARGAA